MKDLLSKEDYCNKIHTLMKSSAYPIPSIDNSPIWTIDYPPDLPSSTIFQKSQPYPLSL